MESWREELYTNELYHHGIKGQKWGVRRFQNKDGSYTEEGKKRYAQMNKEKERAPYQPYIKGLNPLPSAYRTGKPYRITDKDVDQYIAKLKDFERKMVNARAADYTFFTFEHAFGNDKEKVREWLELIGINNAKKYLKSMENATAYSFTDREGNDRESKSSLQNKYNRYDAQTISKEEGIPLESIRSRRVGVKANAVKRSQPNYIPSFATPEQYLDWVLKKNK